MLRVKTDTSTFFFYIGASDNLNDTLKWMYFAVPPEHTATSMQDSYSILWHVCAAVRTIVSSVVEAAR